MELIQSSCAITFHPPVQVGLLSLYKNHQWMFCTVFEMGQVLLKPKQKSKIAADNKSLEMFMFLFFGHVLQTP